MDKQRKHLHNNEGKLDGRLKTALDESRLLILGTQVLFGFQFEAVFQQHFSSLPRVNQNIHCVGLMLFVISIALLVAPSIYHQLVWNGESRSGAVKLATDFAGWSMLPFSLGLGAAAFVTFSVLFGQIAAAAFSVVFLLASLGFLYGIGFALKQKGAMAMPKQHDATPLKTKIEQMLTEARVVIPGGQALLGFQFIATLTQVFQELPPALLGLHALGLCSVALAVVMLMTPAAVHRIAYNGEDNEQFFRIGSRLVVAASAPLAIGISADVAVVFYIVTHSLLTGVVTGLLTLIILLACWLGFPIWLRSRRRRNMRESA